MLEIYYSKEIEEDGIYNAVLVVFIFILECYDNYYQLKDCNMY